MYSMDFKKIFFAFTILFLVLTAVYVRISGLRSLLKTAVMKVVVEQFTENNGTKAPDLNNQTSGSISLLMGKLNNTIIQPQTTSGNLSLERKNHTANLQPTEATKTYKLVLFYTPQFGSIPWVDAENVRDSNAFTHTLSGKPCKVTNCKISYDKKDLARSDAVMFHGRDLPSVNTMKDISRNRILKQRWTLYLAENPYNAGRDMKMYNNFFNWTVTYRRASDVFVTYGYYSLLSSSEKPKTRDNYAQGKDKLIAWIVSHCGALRDKVTAKLLKYVDVTVFGACAKQFGQSNRCDKGSAECEKLLKRFKFYLAFENNNCIDYVTEKYWYTPFQYDMVPIVLGPLKYDSKIAIPGSYINVMDFPSVEKLASYLKYLDKNNTAYNEYFKWKLKYKVEDEDPWNCQMCEQLNNPKIPAKVYDKLGEFFDTRTCCKQYEDKVRELVER